MRSWLVVLLMIRTAHASDATARIKDGHIATGATYAGLQFEDAACKRAFGSHGKVAAAQRKKFGTCLRAMLDHGQESAGSDDKTETIQLDTPTHGFEIVFTCGPHKGSCISDDGDVTSVRGYERAAANAAVSKQIADHTIAPNDAIKAGMAKTQATSLAATVHSCFLATGAWKGSFVSRESGVPAFDGAAARAVPHDIAPYKIDGVAVPVCVDLDFTSR